MKKITLLLILLSALSIQTTTAQVKNSDSKRIAELNEYWAELSKTVREGDYKGYGDMYHPDAVVIFLSLIHI